MVSAHRPQQVQRALERLSAFACQRSSGSCRRPRSAFADRSFTFRYRSGVGGFPGEALSGLPAASCRAGAKGRCGSCQGTGPSDRASFRRRRSRRFFPASCRRYASSLVRPSGMDRRRIWRCNAQYFSEISSSRLDSSCVQSLPPSSAQQRSSASSDRNRILDGLAVRSSTGLPTVRADIKTSPNSPPASCTAERLSCPSCVYRHASTRPDSTIPAWSIRSPMPPDHAVFSKAGRAGGKLLQQPVQPLRRKLCEKPVLQQNALLFICQHFALLFVAAATYFFE